ncbi:MAG: Rne/Rng family ribonuclease [Bacteroidales bacterium]|nr:Rne/Rng family ribonuclease [Bacteroidales bacterium]
MTNELVINVNPSEISIALLEDQKLVELSKERSDAKFAVGDIYLGRVKKLMPGLNAAFVDVGYEKDAFLHYHDLGPQFKSLNKLVHLALSKKAKLPSYQKFKLEHDIDKNGKIADVLKQGQYVMVQVTKEPISSKGPRLSSEISIPGRNIVLMPFSNKVSISQKIESQEEKNRLKTLLLSIRPKNYGIIVRTVAETKKVAELDAELRGLVKKWETAFETLRGATPPKLIISELKRTSTILRDLLKDNFSNIYVDDESICHEIRDYIGEIAPGKEKIVKHFSKNVPIFDHFGIDKQIKSSFGKTVSFRNGAYLIIEHTEALHVIDVNSGNRSKTTKNQEANALDVNIAATDEIARQLRLRDIGGIIVVDFIDMHQNENKQKVMERMREAMSKDRTKHNILPLSKFGLMQITRQRVRPEMNIDVTEKCPVCQGKETITPTILFVDELENYLSSVVKEQKQKYILLKVHPFIEAYINQGFKSVRRKWKKTLKCKIDVESVSSYGLLEFRFFNKENEEIAIN